MSAKTAFIHGLIVAAGFVATILLARDGALSWAWAAPLIFVQWFLLAGFVFVIVAPVFAANGDEDDEA